MPQELHGLCMSMRAAGNGATSAAWPLREPVGSRRASDPSVMSPLQMSLLRVKNGYPVRSETVDAHVMLSRKLPVPATSNVACGDVCLPPLNATSLPLSTLSSS